MTKAIVGFIVQMLVLVPFYWFAWQRGRQAGLREAQAEIHRAREREWWALDEKGPAA